jgi:hypothetical protein
MQNTALHYIPSFRIYYTQLLTWCHSSYLYTCDQGHTLMVISSTHLYRSSLRLSYSFLSCSVNRRLRSCVPLILPVSRRPAVSLLGIWFVFSWLPSLLFSIRFMGIAISICSMRWTLQRPRHTQALILSREPVISCIQYTHQLHVHIQDPVRLMRKLGAAAKFRGGIVCGFEADHGMILRLRKRISVVFPRQSAD